MRIGDQDKRAKIASLKKEIRAIERGDREKDKARRAKEKRERTERVGETADGQRKPRKRNPAYLNFIRRLPCCICGKSAPSEAAHVRSGYPDAGWRPTGMAEKPDDRRTVPLCGMCHREGPQAQHRANERAWWDQHGIYPPRLCEALQGRFAEEQE